MVRWGLIGASTIGREWMVPAIDAQPDSTVAAVASSESGAGETLCGRARYPEGVCVGRRPACRARPLTPSTSARPTSGMNLRLWRLSQPESTCCAKSPWPCRSTARAEWSRPQPPLASCLGTNHHLRNAATHRKMRELIETGAIGRPLAARVFHAVYLPPHLQGWRIDRPEAGGGVILDITVHDADTLRFALGDEVAEVTAMTANQGMGQPGWKTP